MSHNSPHCQSWAKQKHFFFFQCRFRSEPDMPWMFYLNFLEFRLMITYKNICLASLIFIPWNRGTFNGSWFTHTTIWNSIMQLLNGVPDYLNNTTFLRICDQYIDKWSMGFMGALTEMVLLQRTEQIKKTDINIQYWTGYISKRSRTESII